MDSIKSVQNHIEQETKIGTDGKNLLTIHFTVACKSEREKPLLVEKCTSMPIEVIEIIMKSSILMLFAFLISVKGHRIDVLRDVRTVLYVNIRGLP